MARTKGSVQREKEQDSDSDRRPAERRKAESSKRGDDAILPDHPSMCVTSVKR